jgi:hypothetical protein
VGALREAGVDEQLDKGEALVLLQLARLPPVDGVRRDRAHERDRAGADE